MGEPEGVKSKTLWIRPAYLDWILAGRKTVEVRVGYSNIRRLRVGDRLLLNDVHPYLISRVSLYPGFVALLDAEDIAAIAPGMPADDLLDALRTIYPPEKEALGAVALHLVPEGR